MSFSFLTNQLTTLLERCQYTLLNSIIIFFSSIILLSLLFVFFFFPIVAQYVRISC